MKPRTALILIALLLAIGTPLRAQLSPGQYKKVLRTIQAAPTWSALIDSLSRRDPSADAASLPGLRQALWEKYRQHLLADSAATQAFRQGMVQAGGKTMSFSLTRVGTPPDAGYPVYIALHGGGGGPSKMNDQQWEAMGRYYLPGIDTGLYIAPRGISDTWDLHFQHASYMLYDRLIERLIVHEGADPDRIYLLGYSAGGDGVYQVAPRMPARFAAVSMSAGHPNGVPLHNLHHLPILLQCGDLDTAYRRNKVTAEMALRLDTLAQRHPGLYTHQGWIHHKAQHSYVKDRGGKGLRAPVHKDNAAWLAQPAKADTTHQITDAPTWLSRHRRTLNPTHIIWDPATRHPVPHYRHYWVSGDSWEDKDTQPIILKADPAQNSLDIQGFRGRLFIDLHEELFDPAKPIKVTVDGKTHTVSPKVSLLKMATGIEATGDPRRAGYQTLVIIKTAAGLMVQ